MTESREILEVIAEKISKQVGSRRDTFVNKNSYILSELGGTFQSTCSERDELVTCGDYEQYIMPYTKKFFVAGNIAHISTPAFRLYYEALRQYTWYELLCLSVHGQGIFEVSVIAQTTDRELCIAKSMLTLKDDTAAVNMNFFDLNTLPPNGSLTVLFKCLSSNGYISGYRWIGKVPAQKARLGDRLYLIRTFGCRQAVLTALKNITEKLRNERTDILKRTLFILYDACTIKNDLKDLPEITSARIIEIQGDNFGGGGNASLLTSLILRIQATHEDIAELIIMDDDARIDAETIIRQDAFITGGKDSVISTATVFSRQYPTIIQESGGYWGKFFLENSGYVFFNGEDSKRVLYPYLVRSQQDVSESNIQREISRISPIEFATFIFISFPFRTIQETGAPYPFFLRNDDVELCLRAITKGFTIFANPNLQVWHDASHSPVGEFYSVLHGLIVNAAGDALDKTYFYITFMERLANLLKAGNCPMLLAYAHVLRLFAQGPCWMHPESIFGVYASVRNDISSLIQQAKVIPNEVIEAHNECYQLISFADNNPHVEPNKTVVLIDTNTNKLLFYKKQKFKKYSELLCDDCISDIAKIVEAYSSCIQSWKEQLNSFEHVEFWDSVPSAKNTKIISIQEKFTSVYHTPLENIVPAKTEVLEDAELAQPNANLSLPQGFNADRYLRLNPDVAASGMAPDTHWISHGKNEGRQY